MNYQQFAGLYDRLMEDAPYDMWVSFFRNAIDRYGINNTLDVLDVGCGTGEISVRLGLEGYHVQGIDLSEEMLAVARKKAENHDLEIPFFQQDMRELEGFSNLDAAIIFCDSLNYLPTIEDVKVTFERIAHTLKDDGLFMFDVHSLYKIEEVFGNETFTLNEEEISYIWECHQGAKAGSIHHDLSFFVQEKESVYNRYDESHYQITYPMDTYVHLLKDAGFEVCSITSDFSDREPDEQTERLFFIAKKIQKG
ncbi:class I SAM-dependent methyltransferase [Pseudalkalibacillus sp. SCS-8]|uniref:class I SAM-dependent DNA methyltransferase n=1 Tax=Pseudalkalibacillus nanhaiensis TaxID=3115291 RepID=UPI0032DA4C3B